MHYALLRNHVHLIVEAKDRYALSRGMKSLSRRMAWAMQRAFRVAGRAAGGSLPRTHVAADRGMAATRVARSVRCAGRNACLALRLETRPTAWLGPRAL